MTTHDAFNILIGALRATQYNGMTPGQLQALLKHVEGATKEVVVKVSDPYYNHYLTRGPQSLGPTAVAGG